VSGEQETTRPRSPKGTFLPVPETKERAALLLARYDAGELIEKVAKDLKITHQAAYKSLLKYCQEDWKDSQVARALAEYERAKNKVAEIGRRKRTEKYDAQNDQVALACAREELRSAQWELERLCNRLFGNKQEVTNTLPVQVNIGIVRNDAVQPVQRNTENNVIDVTVETK
jgi:predicted transcriptional regulator